MNIVQTLFSWSVQLVIEEKTWSVTYGMDITLR